MIFMSLLQVGGGSKAPRINVKSILWIGYLYACMSHCVHFELTYYVFYTFDELGLDGRILFSSFLQNPL